MAKIYLTQRTNRHIVKRLNSDVVPAIYELSFGQYGVPSFANTNLNFPQGLTVDDDGSIYVCDSRNYRVIKFDSNLNFLLSYDVSLTVGVPYLIYYDSITNDLYVVGIEKIYGTSIKIERITKTFVSVKVSSNMQSIKDLSFKPTTICRGFVTDSFLIGGASLDLLETIESVNFSNFTVKSIFGESSKFPELFANNKYNGFVKHSNGFLYVNNGQKILKVENSISNSFINTGDSNFISKTIFGLRQSVDGSLLLYNVDNKSLQKYDTNLNFVNDIYVDTGNEIENSAYDIMDFVEVN